MLPLDSFAEIHEPALAIDADGRIIMINRAAALFFEIDAAKARGMHCWQAARLLTERGDELCDASCTVQKELCRNRAVPRQRAIHCSSRGQRTALDVFTVPLTESATSRTACVHLMAPCPDDHQAPGSPSADAEFSRETSRSKARVARLLTRREVEILELLSQGRRTAHIARSLSVSVSTVRNHIEHIHAKLGVRRRVDAILLWLSLS